MNKRGMIAETARRTEMTHTKTEQVINHFLDVIGDELLTNGTIYLTGLGRLEVRIRSARAGQNPRTGEPLAIPPIRTVGFKTSKLLRKKLKQSMPD